MTLWIQPEQDWDTNRLLAEVLIPCKAGERVQFLVDARAPGLIAQRLRVALTRSRNRHRRAGRPVDEFTLRHDIYPYTKDGKRFACIVMWIEKDIHHLRRELLDDLMERNQTNVA